jgi:hypothetical protein
MFYPYVVAELADTVALSVPPLPQVARLRRGSFFGKRAPVNVDDDDDDDEGTSHRGKRVAVNMEFSEENADSVTIPLWGATTIRSTLRLDNVWPDDADEPVEATGAGSSRGVSAPGPTKLGRRFSKSDSQDTMELASPSPRVLSFGRSRSMSMSMSPCPSLSSHLFPKSPCTPGLDTPGGSRKSAFYNIAAASLSRADAPVIDPDEATLV